MHITANSFSSPLSMSHCFYFLLTIAEAFAEARTVRGNKLNAIVNKRGNAIARCSSWDVIHHVALQMRVPAIRLAMLT